MTQFSNARKQATFENWPSGSRRVNCTFEIESNKKGDKQRVSRTTTGKPKKSTYYEKAVIVDGDDDKTYILATTGIGMIYIVESNLKYSQSVWEKDEQYEELLGMIDAA